MPLTFRHVDPFGRYQESLSETVEFSSYVTFYLAFKSITGMSTQAYMKKFQVGLKRSPMQLIFNSFIG